MNALDTTTSSGEQTRHSLSLFWDQAGQEKRMQKVRMRILMSAFVTGIIVTCSGVYWIYENFLQQSGESSLVYYEIKAIDGSGHPVAGALVSVENKEQGITDSFGEWRQYLPTPLNSMIRLDIIKETEAGTLRASQEIRAPDDRSKAVDLSIFKTVALMFDKSPVGSKQTTIVKK